MVTLELCVGPGCTDCYGRYGLGGCTGSVKPTGELNGVVPKLGRSRAALARPHSARVARRLDGASKRCSGRAARLVTRVARAHTWLFWRALSRRARATRRYASSAGVHGLSERLDLVSWCICAAPARRLLGVW